MSPTNSSKMLVTFWGSRGSISTPGNRTEKYGGNTPCIFVSHGDTQIILDAGTGIRDLGHELTRQTQQHKKKLRLHLLLSHTHWDHIQGLPFFSPAYMRGTKLSVYGSPKKEMFLESILGGQMDLNYFPVAMNDLAAEMKIIEFTKRRFKIGSVAVEWEEQICHPGGSVRYKLSVGRRKVVYATDVELDKIFRNGPKAVKNRKALGRQYRAFIRGADLLIADGQYAAEEYPAKIGWGHTSIPVLLDVAYREGVKQLAVFHHDPQHPDVILDHLWAQYGAQYGSKDPPMSVFWAREGITLAI
jgi:phosphoribosyl 1,2-cyclic phosphodiesterase